MYLVTIEGVAKLSEEIVEVGLATASTAMESISPKIVAEVEITGQISFDADKRFMIESANSIAAWSLLKPGDDEVYKKVTVELRSTGEVRYELPYAFVISYNEEFEDQNGFFKLVVKEVNPERAGAPVAVVTPPEEVTAEREESGAGDGSVNDIKSASPIIKGERGRKELMPNTRHTSAAGYVYTTDAKGRIIRVEADPLILKTAQRNEGMQRIVGREDRLSDDDGGHLIASQFFGSGDIDNLVAMCGKINRSGGQWYNMENEWANALKEDPPLNVSVVIEPVYSGDSLRPDSFRIRYTIEGQDEKRIRIRNRK